MGKRRKLQTEQGPMAHEMFKSCIGACVACFQVCEH
jgi:hypothetical protein